MGSMQGSTSCNEAKNIYFSFIAGGIGKVPNRKFEDDNVEDEKKIAFNRTTGRSVNL